MFYLPIGDSFFKIIITMYWKIIAYGKVNERQQMCKSQKGGIGDTLL